MNKSRNWVLFRERVETTGGPNTTDISLTVNEDGSVRIDGCYAGPQARVVWGDWDHEFWLVIPPGYLPALLAGTLSDAFTCPDRLTYARLVDVLRRRDIPFTQGHWT